MNKAKLWRIERGLSQWELADATGIPRWKLQLFEGGHRLPTQDEINTFAAALNIDPRELFPKSEQLGQAETQGRRA